MWVLERRLSESQEQCWDCTTALPKLRAFAFRWIYIPHSWHRSELIASYFPQQLKLPITHILLCINNNNNEKKNGIPARAILKVRDFVFLIFDVLVIASCFFALNIIFMYVLLYIDVNNMLVSWCFICERQTCVPPSRPTIVDVKSRINKMAHNNYSFFLSFVLNECPLSDPKMHKFTLFSVALLHLVFRLFTFFLVLQNEGLNFISENWLQKTNIEENPWSAHNDRSV